MPTHDDLVTRSAVELRRLIGTKQISPVELLEACIERITAINPAVNAITAKDYEAARKNAREAEKQVLAGAPLGLLHGLPLGVKDLDDTAGLLTTYGSPMSRGHVPTEDTAAVARLRAAGAIVTAKTNVPELGAGANTRNPVWGATGNPFNPALNAGGSSGGSAVALACDMLPVCTGSDTGGSLRIPAAKCGVVGFRPSPGLVPSSRRLLGWSALAVVGPMGRDVADTALQLAASVGLSNREPLSFDADPQTFLQLEHIDPAQLRVGYTEDFDCCDVDEGIRTLFRARITELGRLVKTCEPVRFDMAESHRAFDVLRATSFVAKLHETYTRNPELLGPNPRANYELGAAMTMADSAWAQAEQTRLFHKFQQTFSQYDIIVSPTTPVSPFSWRELYATHIDGIEQENYYRWLALTYVITMTTHPALSLPCGVDQAGMPFGLQIVGPFRGDARTLAVAQALEQAFSNSPTLRRPRPDLSTLQHANPDLTSIVTAPPEPTAKGAPAASLSVV